MSRTICKCIEHFLCVVQHHICVRLNRVCLICIPSPATNTSIVGQLCTLVALKAQQLCAGGRARNLRVWVRVLIVDVFAPF